MIVRRKDLRFSERERKLRRTEAEHQLLLMEVQKWEQEHKMSVLADESAADSLVTLFHKGVHPIDVLELLRGYVIHDAEIAHIVKYELDDPRITVPPVKKIIRHLRKSVAEMREVLPDTSKRVCEQMESFADYVEDRHVPIMKWKPPKGMRADDLYEAVELVRIATGRQHYREIAAILLALSGKDHDEPVLRRIVDEYKKRPQHHSSTAADLRRRIVWGRRRWRKLRHAARTNQKNSLL